MKTRVALALGTLWLSLPIAASATPTVAVLRVVGDRALARRVAGELSAALGHLRLRPIAAAAAATQLRQATPRRAVAATRTQLDRGERALLAMKRAATLGAARRARARLGAGARFFAPRLVARAHLLEASALLLLKPHDPAAARPALAAALDADPRLAPTDLHPRVARLLRQVRDERRRPQATRDELARLARLAPAWTALAAVHVARAGAQVQLEIALYRGGGAGAFQLLRQRTTEERAGAVAAQLVATALGAPAAGARRRPWYRKWWVWTLVGVATAAAVAGGVILIDRLDDGVDVRFSFR